jgi:hypothetical protein
MANSLGDSYVLASSQVRFSAMYSQVRRDIQWLSLTKKCDEVVVIAHSQGAAVAHEALCQEPQLRVSRFITLGSGQGKLHALRQMLPNHGRVLVGSILRTAGVGGFAFVFLIALPYYDLFGPWIVWIIILSQVMLWGGMFLMSVGVKPLTREELAIPGLPPEHYKDYYATDDPVPDDPVLETSKRISNWRSLQSDHSAYWQNREEFVAAVASDLAAVGGWSTEEDEGDRETLRIAKLRRKDRVRALWTARCLSYFTILLAWYIFWPELSAMGEPIRESVVAVGATVLSFLPFLVLTPSVGGADVGQAVEWWSYFMGAVAVIIMIVVWQQLIIFQAWRAWDWLEAQRMFKRELHKYMSFSAVLFLVISLVIPAGSSLAVLMRWPVLDPSVAVPLTDIPVNNVAYTGIITALLGCALVLLLWLRALLSHRVVSQPLGSTSVASQASSN